MPNKTIFSKHPLTSNQRVPRHAKFIVDENIPKGTKNNPTASLDYIRVQYPEISDQIVYRPTK